MKAAKIFLAIAAITLVEGAVGRSASGQDIGLSSRPSFSVLFLDAGDSIVSPDSLSREASLLSDRGDIDLILSESLSSIGINQETVFTRDNENNYDEQVDKWLSDSKVGQDIIHYLFRIDENFQWSNDLLRSRAEYAQTTREAVASLETLRGAQNSARDNAYEALTRVYFVVLTTSSETNSVSQKILGKKIEKSLTSSVIRGSVYKLDFPTKADAIRTLSPFYCDGCEDANALKTEFNNLHLTFTRKWSGTAQAQSIDEGLNQTDKAVAALYSAAIAQIPALQEKVYVSSTGPVSAKIGTKQGARTGRRYKVVRLEADSDTSFVEKKIGYVRGKSITDNRTAAIEVLENGEESIVETKASTFKQVHGKGIDAYDVLIESPTFGLDALVHVNAGSYSSLMADILYHPPGLLGPFVGVTGEIFSEDTDYLYDEDKTWISYRAGLTAGYEMYIARGFLRLIPSASISYQISQPTDATAEAINLNISAFAYRAGLQMALQFSDNLGLFAGASYSSLFGATLSSDASTEIETVDWGANFKSGSGIQIGAGVKLSF